MRPWKLAAALAGAVLVLSTACARESVGGGGGVPSSPSAAPSVATSSTVSSTATKVVLGKSVWYAGMKLTFGSAVSTGEPSGVQVDVVFDNLGPESHNSRNLRMALTVDGTAHSGVVEHGPMLPGSAKTKANVVFRTDGPIGDLSSASITVGDGAEVQAKVPFATDGELVDLAPKTVVSGPKAVTFPELKVTISGCELRADYPARGEQAKKDKRLVVCGFAAHNQTTSFFHVYNQEFQLKAADGTSNSADYGTMQEVGIGGGATHEASLAWEIPWPATQSYVLAVAWLGPGGGTKPSAQNTTEIPLPLA